jgi:hypothetical protein
MPKITYVGAGSAVFARQVITDILCIDGLDTGEIALVDIDEERLDLARQLVEKLVERSGKDWKVVASAERCDVLDGSDYVVNSIEVAGIDNVRHDYDIPLRYGIDQCIGDTIGPGGVFKAPAHRTGLARHLRGCTAPLPQGDHPQLHQPDVDPHTRRAACDRTPSRRSLSLGAGHVAAARRLSRCALRGARVGVRRHQPQRVVHEARPQR